MSSVPTGTVVPSMRVIFWARRWARVTPRVRRPTNVRSLAPSFFSRISWAMRVSARSRADSSRTSAFSRNFGGLLLIAAPCEPRGARLKEFTAPTDYRTLHRISGPCQRLTQPVGFDLLAPVQAQAALVLDRHTTVLDHPGPERLGRDDVLDALAVPHDEVGAA